ncbi:39S ribosomal protein L1, mitochondrial-like isoform X2 [Acanthaster planci]|uniref:39S ribosomal protein L1, mitochondrial-like isoform X2 n=1 Tax=Acanthaster planci TaxID=133434 RepID=A0A8B7XJD7_ACAPL|nr:39S ribosomal protein L1, mitochondrial-like isoform X2 [Acanthaster planci]
MAASMSMMSVRVAAAISRSSSHARGLRHVRHRLQQDVICSFHCQASISDSQQGSRSVFTSPGFSSITGQVSDEPAEETVAEEAMVVQERPKDYLAWKPVDDVYLHMHYPPQLKSFHEAMEILRKQDTWMFCRRRNKYADRTVTISVNLDMALKKKKLVDPFQSMLILPHAFKPDNTVLCFARGSDAQVAIDARADIVGGEELVPKVLSKEVKDFDYCVSSPDMMAELAPLRQLLRKRFPNSKRGSVGLDLPSMIHRYKKGQEYKCQIKGKHVNVAIGKLSLTNDQLEENMQCIITDICKHKPPEFGPFVTKLTINAFLLDGVRINFEKYLPAPVDELESVGLSSEQEKVIL